MASKSTGTLIYQWTADNREELRLIAVGHCTPGYEDRYVIERREPDSLGDMCWVFDTQWTANCDNPTSTMLVVALKAAGLCLQTAPPPRIRRQRAEFGGSDGRSRDLPWFTGSRRQ